MADDPNAKRQLADLPPRPQGKPGALISAALYEAMWETYRDGLRTKAELVQRYGISMPTARKAIEKGWPDRGFKALKTRALDHDEQRAAAERQAATDAFRERTDAWYRAGKQFNRVADSAVTFCIAALQQIGNLALVRDADGRASLRRLTKWVKRRTVDVAADGTRTVRYFDEEVPLTVQEAVKLQAEVMKGAALASAFKKLWPQTSDEQRAAEGAPPEGLAALTTEQLNQFAETGQLPPGMTPEDVFGVHVQGTQVEQQKKKGRRPN